LSIPGMTEDQTCHDQHDRVRNLDLAGQRGENNDEKQEQEKDKFDTVNAVSLHAVLPPPTRYLSLRGASNRARIEGAGFQRKGAVCSVLPCRVYANGNYWTATGGKNYVVPHFDKGAR
jgi:hypothetical protein